MKFVHSLVGYTSLCSVLPQDIPAWRRTLQISTIHRRCQERAGHPVPHTRELQSAIPWEQQSSSVSLPLWVLLRKDRMQCATNEWFRSPKGLLTKACLIQKWKQSSLSSSHLLCTGWLKHTDKNQIKTYKPKSKINLKLPICRLRMKKRQWWEQVRIKRNHCGTVFQPESI